jgi:nitrite reductase/ring-hydroxylating ferredoxin subunit
MVMRHQDQVAEARKLLYYLDTRTTAMADAVYRNPVTDYTCPRQAALEREAFFRRGPINIGLGCLLPNPGDYMTHDYTDVPILLVRRPDGFLGACLNVCRHRGARVAEGCGAGATSFCCPYHGWTYGLDGSLVARPDERSFDFRGRSERSQHPNLTQRSYGDRRLPGLIRSEPFNHASRRNRCSPVFTMPTPSKLQVTVPI